MTKHPPFFCFKTIKTVDFFRSLQHPHCSYHCGPCCLCAKHFNSAKNRHTLESAAMPLISPVPFKCRPQISDTVENNFSYINPFVILCSIGPLLLRGFCMMILFKILELKNVL